MDSDQKKQRLTTALKWGLGIVGLAVITPVVFLALKAALGLLALGVAGVAGVAFIRLMPVMSMKLSNTVIKLIVREAEANPIETMENLKIEKLGELQKADNAIIEFEASVRNYDDDTRQFTKDYPDEAAAYQEISSKMHEALKLQTQQQDGARLKLNDLALRIEKARAIYKMALSAQRVTQLSKSAEAKVFQDIKEKIAFESVRMELNRSFASLNMAISQQKAVPALPMRPAVTVQ